MHPMVFFARMDFSQGNLFGYIEDLQELTIIERPVRRSLKVSAPRGTVLSEPREIASAWAGARLPERAGCLHGTRW